MTFGIGIKVREDIAALADTQIVVGSERVSKQKLAALYHANDSMFAMASGLRLVRDKSLTYLSERLRNQVEPLNRLFRVVKMFGEELRKVRQDDGPSLASSNTSFNPRAMI